MAIPDITGLTEAELDELSRLAQARRASLVNSEENNRAAPLDRDELVKALAGLVALTAELTAIVDTPNADLNARPGPAITKLARGLRRVTNNVVRLVRVSGGLLDSTDIGTPEPPVTP